MSSSPGTGGAQAGFYKDIHIENQMSDTFQQWAEAARQIAEEHRPDAKIRHCATYLQSLNTDRGLRLASRYFAEGAFPARSEQRIAIGSRTYSTCAAEFCEIDYERVFKPCKDALSNASEAIEKLMNNIKAARDKRTPAGLTLSDVQQGYEKLSRLTGRSEKQEFLTSIWKKMSPVEIKYFIRIMRGTPGIGLASGQVISAIAKAFGKNADRVQYAHMMTGSMERTALLCRHNQLEDARFSLFHPLSLMTASPFEDHQVHNFDNYVAEENFDGLRAQIHISDNRVKLFSSDGRDITGSYPDIIQFFSSRNLPDVALDGVICIYRNKEILPFKLLENRIKSKKPSSKLREKYPVVYISFDILYHKSDLISEHILTQRRQVLKELSEEFHFPLANQFEVSSQDRVNDLYKRSLDRGNRGIVLKNKDSAYQFGRSGRSWLKIENPGGSLATVIMYAHTESGINGIDYSDFTLGVRVEDDERYNEEFIPIGKAPYKNFNEKEIGKIKEHIKELTVERYGPTLGLLPEIVVELDFDDIRINKRTKANYVLQRPRIKTIHWNSSPRQAATLKDIERMYHQKIEKDRLMQGRNPSFLFLNP